MMQELVGRLTALDPQASENVKVIAYFDALVDGHANAEILLRGAAVLSGCGAGFIADGALLRVDNNGSRAPLAGAPAAGSWPEHAIADAGSARAWLERRGGPQANDAMILERLAIALGIMLERSGPRAAVRRTVAQVLDSASTPDERRAAALRLRLDPLRSYRVVATPAATPAADNAAAAAAGQGVVDTPAGRVRATIIPADRIPASGEVPAEGGWPRAGVGTAANTGALDESWASALLALRLTGGRESVLYADELGSVLWLADAADRHPGEHPDVTALKETADGSERTLGILAALAGTDSLRGAAVMSGLHHSTLQARAVELSRGLGFDIRTPSGRTRLSLALRLYYLASNRF